VSSRGWGSGVLALGLVLALGAVLSGAALADETVYRNRTVRLIVGYPPGGGFDVYSRILGQHLGRHISGAPTLVVENMPGAGGLIAANYLYRIARPDGLTIGHFTGGLLLGAFLQQPGVAFDARGFEYVGAPDREQIACGFNRASGITSAAAWRAARVPIRMGGTGLGTAQESATRIVRTALELPIHIVSGYRGTGDIRLAVEQQELAGACLNWGSMRNAWAEALRTGEMTVVLVVSPRPIAELPGVPLAIELARTPEARRLVEIGVHDQSVLARPFALPPGTPAVRVHVVRDAFQATLADPAFRVDAERAKLEVNPVSGEELGLAVSRVSALEPEMLRKLRAVLLE
jgi:tripartite-type tricarboxylate transporter receptor subunit TctC